MGTGHPNSPVCARDDLGPFDHGPAAGGSHRFGLDPVATWLRLVLRQGWGVAGSSPAVPGSPKASQPSAGIFLPCGFVQSLFEALGNILHPSCATGRRPPCPSTRLPHLTQELAPAASLSRRRNHYRRTRNEPPAPFQPERASEQLFVTGASLCFYKGASPSAGEKQRPAAGHKAPAACFPSSHSLLRDTMRSVPKDPRGQQVPGPGRAQLECTNLS